MDASSVEAEIASLKINVNQLAQRVRTLEKLIDTLDSPWWKRLQWRVIDGYPPWYRVGTPRSFRDRLRRWEWR
jgi:hypothetical protein